MLPDLDTILVGIAKSLASQADRFLIERSSLVVFLSANCRSCSKRHPEAHDLSIWLTSIREFGRSSLNIPTMKLTEESKATLLAAGTIERLATVTVQ